MLSGNRTSIPSFIVSCLPCNGAQSPRGESSDAGDRSGGSSTEFAGTSQVRSGSPSTISFGSSRWPRPFRSPGISKSQNSRDSRSTKALPPRECRCAARVKAGQIEVPNQHFCFQPASLDRTCLGLKCHHSWGHYSKSCEKSVNESETSRLTMHSAMTATLFACTGHTGSTPATYRKRCAAYW